MIDWAVRGTRVFLPEGPRPAAVLVEGGRIAAVARPDEVPAGAGVVEAGDLAVIPALVDAHVHVNEPGRTEWEGFSTATAAAAAGGIGAIADMPLNCSPVTTRREALEAKVAAARGRLGVDCAFWGGLVPGGARELPGLAAAGAAGVKCFLCPSGLEEFPPVTTADLEEALPVLRDLGLPLLVHAELEPGGPAEGPSDAYARYLGTRPASMEARAAALMAELCRRHRARIHIVHLGAAEALPVLARAKEEGLPLTAETCPHYLTFCAEEVPRGATEFKCAPPIRGAENREALWDALAKGLIDFVASDHSPCVPAMKRREAGDFLGAWGGISGLQLLLPAAWTGAKRRGFELEEVLRWTSARPAAFVGLKGKGRLEAGGDADLALFDDAGLFDVSPEELRHRHKLTPYAGRRLLGRVLRTWVGGRPAFGQGQPPFPPAGRALLRKGDSWTSPA